MLAKALIAYCTPSEEVSREYLLILALPADHARLRPLLPNKLEYRIPVLVELLAANAPQSQAVPDDFADVNVALKLNFSLILKHGISRATQHLLAQRANHQRWRRVR